MAQSQIERRYAAEGDWGHVEFAIRSGGRAEAEEFLESLLTLPGLRGKGEKVHDKFVRLFQQMANCGGGLKKERFSREKGDIYGFKYELMNQLMRIPCFQDGNCWVLTHGFIKRGAQKGRGKWPPEALDKAEQIMHEHLKLTGK